jgi:hypothetical protein
MLFVITSDVSHHEMRELVQRRTMSDTLSHK